MPTQKINLWNPHEKQREIMESDARYKVAVCGRRFGKTVYAVNRLIKQALLDTNQDYFYIAPTYRQGKMIAWKMLKNKAEELPEELVHKINESELYVKIGNDCQISIKGADKPDSLRGVGLGGVVLDEYADMKPNVFSEIIRPTLIDSGGWAVFIGTPRGFNHFYDLYMEAQNKEDWDSFRFPTYENPYVPDEEVDKEKEQMNADQFAQEYLAKFRKRQGLVYPEFERETHVVGSDEDRGTIIEKIGALDFGYTNPAAFLVIYKNEMGEYYVEKEWYRTGKTNAEIGEYIKSDVEGKGISYIYPDPAEPDRIDELNTIGVPTREVNKGSGSVEAGINKVRNLLKSKKLYVDESCKNLISEFETYHYPEDKDTKLNKEAYEKPVKEDDHGMDAVRYALFMHAPADHEPGADKTDFNLYGHDDYGNSY